MNAFSPINSYVLGAASVGLGLHAFLRPREETTRFGLPLEAPSTTRKPGPSSKETTGARAIDRPAGEDGSASPLIYIKGIREVSYGVALVALQYQGNVAGITTVAGVLALTGLGDGIVIWSHAGREGTKATVKNTKAWGHWGAALGLGCWAAWRAFVAYGEWAAFHALNY